MKKEPCDKLYRLHLRLRMELDAEEEKTLKKYGKVKKELSRDLAVPSDITLHALHFAIQQAFGWRNSHLHRFTLDQPFTSDRTAKLTGLTRRTAILTLLSGRTAVGALLSGGTSRPGRRRIVPRPAHNLTDSRLLRRGSPAGIRIIRRSHVGFCLLRRFFLFCGGFGGLCGFLCHRGFRFFPGGFLGFLRRFLRCGFSCLGSLFLAGGFHHLLLVVVQHRERLRMGRLRLHLFLLPAACGFFFGLAVHF